MKLTLALGLQYDHKPASLYALSVGRERAPAAPEAVVELSPLTSTTSLQQEGSWFVLTYNTRGLPVMLPPAPAIDLFG